jgi:RNA polymerase sigma-70 factor (ECF subfamily)
MSSSATSRFSTLPLAAMNPRSPDANQHDPAASSKLTDEALMARIREDDKEALALLFRRYVGLVRSVGRRIIRNDAEAEDLVQEVFLYLYRKRTVYDSSRSSARSWIVQMAYQQSIQRVRYLTTRQFYTGKNLDDEAARRIGSLTTEDDYSAEVVLRKTGLLKALKDLSNEQRETLELHFFEGYTLKEISVKTDQPHGNVRHHYYRGLGKLRRAFFGNKVHKT